MRCVPLAGGGFACFTEEVMPRSRHDRLLQEEYRDDPWAIFVILAVLSSEEAWPVVNVGT